MLQVEPNKHKIEWVDKIITTIVVCLVLLGLACPFLLYHYGKPFGDWNWEFPLTFIGVIVYFIVFGIFKGGYGMFLHKGYYDE